MENIISLKAVQEEHNESLNNTRFKNDMLD